jgi:hypothetical protein
MIELVGMDDMDHRVPVKIIVRSTDPNVTLLCSEALRVGRPPGMYLTQRTQLEGAERCWEAEIDVGELLRDSPWLRAVLNQ